MSPLEERSWNTFNIDQCLEGRQEREAHNVILIMRNRTLKIIWICLDMFGYITINVIKTMKPDPIKKLFLSPVSSSMFLVFCPSWEGTCGDCLQQYWQEIFDAVSGEVLVKMLFDFFLLIFNKIYGPCVGVVGCD